MKRIPYLIALSSLYLFPLACQAGTANVRLYCLSLKFSQSRDNMIPQDILDLTSTGLRDAGLGELEPPLPFYEPPLPGTEGYYSNILLQDPYSGLTFGGIAYLSLPPMDDADGNRYPDFFEVSKSVNFTRPYCMMDITGYGTVYPSVAWSRAAGSKNGTCTIAINDNYFGTFRAPFELTEYTGTLTYTPGSPVVSGTVNLSQTGNSSKTITGAISFTKSTGDPYNSLTNQPGTWSGVPVVTQSFTNHYFSRDINWPSNYVGLVEFSDGNEWTFEPYANWVLSITDMTDSDGDGIPDFSDDAQVVQPPRPPRLSIAIDSSGVRLTIAGDVGHLHEIQEAASLTNPNWQPVQSVTLSSDPQTVTLVLPTGPKFWRVVAQ